MVYIHFLYIKLSLLLDFWDFLSNIGFWHFVIVYNLIIPVTLWFLLKGGSSIETTNQENSTIQKSSRLNYRTLGIAAVFGILVALPGLLYTFETLDNYHYIYSTFDEPWQRWQDYLVDHQYSAQALSGELLSGASLLLGIMTFLVVQSFFESKGAEKFSGRKFHLFAPLFSIVCGVVATIVFCASYIIADYQMSLQSVHGWIGGFEPGQYSVLSSFANTSQLLPVTSELVLGILLLELVYLGSDFFAANCHSSDKRIRNIYIYRNLTVAMAIYLSIFLFFSYRFLSWIWI